jgi:hypothetical protein
MGSHPGLDCGRRRDETSDFDGIPREPISEVLLGMGLSA